MSSLCSRIISSIIFFPLVIFLIFFVSFEYFIYFFIFISTLAIWEWTQFFGWKSFLRRILYSVFFCFLLLFLEFYLNKLNYQNKEVIISFILFFGIIWWFFATLLVITFPFSLKLWSKKISLKILFNLLSIFPFHFGVTMLKGINYSINNIRSSLWIFYLIVLVWSADTGAYIIGNLFGKHKFVNFISPKKTVEGLIGGIFFSLIFSFLFNLFFNISINLFIFLLFSLFIILISIIGDLTESMFKRQSGIKDSGNLIPGHGGLLDRIDSLISVVPFFVELILLVKKNNFFN